MSRAYQIRIKESVKEHIRVQDGVCSSLEILDILPRETMGEILARALAEKGFERDGDVMRRVDEGIEIEVDLKEGTVSARLAAEKDLDLTVERSRTVAEEIAARETERLREHVKQGLQREVESERERLTDEVASKLEKHLINLRRELDQVVNRVTAEALKQKAASLGEIQEVSEDPETGSITIKVKV
jgi:hypothetical protein